MGDYCKEGERGPKGSKWLPMESELAKEKHPGALRKSEPVSYTHLTLPTN